MTDDKRPKPLLTLRPTRVAQDPPQASKLSASAAPGGGGSFGAAAGGGGYGAGGSGSGPKGGMREPPQPPTGRGQTGAGGLRFLGYALAAMIGGITAVAALLILPSAYPPILTAIPQLGAFAPNDLKDEVRRIEDRTASLERAMRSEVAQRNDAVTQEALNEVKGRVDLLVRRVADLDALAAQGEFGGKGPRVATSADAQAEAERAVAPLAERVGALERELGTLHKSQAERQGEAKSAALAIAFTNLKRAVGEGRPFASELATVESLSSRKLPVNQLAVYKDSGVPTADTLTRDFADFSKRAIEKHYQGDSSTFVGEMIARARSAIQVRPVGGSGNTPEAVLGRMGASLQSGQLASAVIEAGALTGRALEEMQPWLQAAQSRVTADTALRQTDEELLAALTKPGVRR